MKLENLEKTTNSLKKIAGDIFHILFYLWAITRF